MKQTRMYGLFERKPGERHWQRIKPTMAYRKDVAVRVFQNALLAPYLDGIGVQRCLRPVKMELPTMLVNPSVNLTTVGL